MVLRVPDATPETIRNLDTQSLAGTLQAILSEPGSEARINEVILSGGRVRVGGSLGKPGDPWLRTVWRRSGPIRPEDFLVDPIDIQQDIEGLNR